MIHCSSVVAEQLQTALHNRVVIEQAKGVLAQHAALDMDEAFERLRGYSRSHNLRLADVARALTTATSNPTPSPSSNAPAAAGEN